MTTQAPDRRLARLDEVAVPLHGTCLIGHVVEDYDGARGAPIRVVFAGQSYVHALARYQMRAAGEAYVLSDGTMVDPVSYPEALRHAVRLARNFAAGEPVVAAALGEAAEFVDAHADEIAGWTPRLAAPAQGWSAEVLDGGPDAGRDVASTLRLALLLAGESMGEEAWAFVHASRHGAKLHRHDDGRWIVLDQEGTPMWTADYPSRDAAARAYCDHHRIAVPQGAPRAGAASDFDRAAHQVAQELIALHGEEIAAMARPAPAFR